MDHFVDERDERLLSGDRYTFFVLSRIMGGQCTLLLTDHERLIICFSCDPYPIWIWTPDHVTNEVKAKAYELVKENGLLTGGHSFNMKYDLAEYFIGRSQESAMPLTIKTNMLAYDCPNPIAPTQLADGECHPCAAENIDEVVKLMDLFHREIAADQQSLEAYRHKAEEAIKSGNLYLWRNAEGKNVAICSIRPNRNLASIGLVYTRPAYRRKHYAQHLVYHVSQMAKDAGYVPMLYADADYVASNACYAKIGYALKGRLCTLGE